MPEVPLNAAPFCSTEEEVLHSDALYAVLQNELLANEHIPDKRGLEDVSWNADDDSLKKAITAVLNGEDMQLTNSQLRKLSTVSTYSRNLIAYAKDCTSANSPDEEVQMTTLYEEILPALAGRFKMRLTKRLRQYLTNTGALPFPFDGEPELLGGLTNEKEVADAAPDDFEYLAQWRRAANDIFAKGANTTEWKHLSEDPVVREMQEDVLFGLLGTFGLGHRQKEKAAAWMLSQMLEEPPRELQAGDKINKPALFFPM